MSNEALHDLTDPGKWDWADPDCIPYLNCSKMMLMKFCPRLYNWKITKRLGGPQVYDLKAAPMVMGSLYHAMTQAEDNGDNVLKCLHAAAEEIRADPQYRVSFSAILDQLVGEMGTVGHTRYKTFIRNQGMYKTLMTEEPLHVPMGKFVLSVIPDKVIEDLQTGEVWVVERKSTARDDASWDRKWALNAQTTGQVVAVEKVLDKPVSGVYLEQVVITRKQSKTWSKPLPQPIHQWTHCPWRAVPKSTHVKDEFIRFGESIVEELRWRYTTGREWDTNYASCERCEASDICLGRRHPAEVLVALKEDYAAKAQRLAHGISRKTASQVIQKTAKAGSDGI